MLLAPNRKTFQQPHLNLKLHQVFFFLQNSTYIACTEVLRLRKNIFKCNASIVAECVSCNAKFELR